MGKQYLQAKVNNLPNEIDKYVVARIDDFTREMWFWGTYNDKSRAEKAVRDVDGVILERMD